MFNKYVIYLTNMFCTLTFAQRVKSEGVYTVSVSCQCVKWEGVCLL